VDVAGPGHRGEYNPTPFGERSGLCARRRPLARCFCAGVMVCNSSLRESQESTRQRRKRWSQAGNKIRSARWEPKGTSQEAGKENQPWRIARSVGQPSWREPPFVLPAEPRQAPPASLPRLSLSHRPSHRPSPGPNLSLRPGRSQRLSLGPRDLLRFSLSTNLNRQQARA
jgi:hypothetical protein